MLLFRHWISPNLSLQTASVPLLFGRGSPPGQIVYWRINHSSLMSLGTLLPRSIHSTEKAAKVSRQGDNDYGQSLDRQAVSGQDLLLFASGSHVNEPHHTDQDA